MDEHEAIATTVKRINENTAMIGMTVSAVMVPGGWTLGVDGNPALPEGLMPLSSHEVLAWLNGFNTGFCKLRDAIAKNRNESLN